MTRRGKVVGGGALVIIGGFLLAINALGGSDLHAAGLQTTGYDITRLFIWGGASALVISALLFISASAE